MKRMTFLCFISAALACLSILSTAGLATDGSVKAIEKGTSEKSNSPLLPVAVGGLIALVGSIGGGTIVFFLQSHNERRIFRRAKLEELVALAYKCDDWLDQLLLGYLVQPDISKVNINSIFEKSPISSMKMLQVRYYPSLLEETDTLIATVKESRESIILERRNLSLTREYSDEFRRNYKKKQDAVSRAIQCLSEKARMEKT